jgi:LPS-assembly lipoprotein
MSLPETRVLAWRPLRAAAILLIAAGAGGCFQPMYADPAVMASAGVPGGLRSALASIDIAQIDAPQGSALARMAVEMRNALVFDFTGGGERAPPRYLLKINLTSNVRSLIVDPSTARPEFETAGVDAVYVLTPITTPPVPPILTASATASVTYNIPGQQQRFAKLRGLRDAETRAAKVLAEQIKSRVAATLAAGA